MKQYFSWVAYLFIYLGLLYFLGCAHQVAPSGGPIDKTPPRVISSFPQPDSVGVRNLKYIEVEFDEAIRQTSLLSNYWMIPEIPGGFFTKWKRSRKIRFYLQDTLAENRTYVFTLGTGITDVHNNKLAAPFQLAFSTGPELNRGLITGHVYGDKPLRDIFIYAYAEEGNSFPDSLLQRKAAYYTQINADGEYRLNYLPWGTYRLLALQDNDYNFVYTPESDMAGIPFTDVALDSILPSFSKMNFYMMQEDTTGPKIKSVDTVFVRELRVTFNEGIALRKDFRIEIWDTLNEAVYQPLAYSINSNDPTLLQIFSLNLPAHQEMVLTLSGLTDLSRNYPADSVLQKTFTNASRQDTLPPRFQSMIPPAGDNAVPYDDSTTVNFTAPVDTALFVRHFSLLDEKGNMVKGVFNLQDLFRPVFKPDSLLEKTAGYTVVLPLDSITDLFGRAFPDTVLNLKFNTINWADLGEISGEVSSSDSSWKKAIVEFQAVAGKNIHRKEVPVRKEYTVPFLPGGFYLPRAVVDVNGNGKWDKGHVSPWEFSEPFIFKQDTVKVRKRWTTQGVNFDFNFRGKNEE